MIRREFTVTNEYPYNRRSPLRWLTSHILRYPILFITLLLTTVAMATSKSMSALG
jgi:ATP-binding cassette subfamily B protein